MDVNLIVAILGTGSITGAIGFFLSKIFNRKTEQLQIAKMKEELEQAKIKTKDEAKDYWKEISFEWHEELEKSNSRIDKLEERLAEEIKENFKLRIDFNRVSQELKSSELRRKDLHEQLDKMRRWIYRVSDHIGMEIREEDKLFLQQFLKKDKDA